MMIYSEESDSVTMNKQVSSLLRNAFDGSKTGQTRASVQSINGQAETLINTLLCGTPDVIISRLKGYVEPTGEPRHWRKVKDVA